MPRKEPNKGGWVWRVRWRDRRGKQHCKTFHDEAKAQKFEDWIKGKKAAGEELPGERGQQTLEEAVEKWLTGYAIPNLTQATRESYDQQWQRYCCDIEHGIWEHTLASLETDLSILSDFFQWILEGEGELVRFNDDGEVVREPKEPGGYPTMEKTKTFLGSVFSWARANKEMTIVPTRLLSFKRAKEQAEQNKRELAIFAPDETEQVRWQLLNPGSRRPKMLCERDAALISFLAYAGCRPGELLYARWKHIDWTEATFKVRGAVSIGEEKETKTYRKRDIDLLAPLVEDLKHWWELSGQPDGEQLIFPRPRDGQVWQRHDWHNWRKRHFKPALKRMLNANPALDADEYEDARPYDLRGSFASVLVAARLYSLTYVADQLGHSVRVLEQHYARVIRRYEGKPPVKPETTIRQARKTAETAGRKSQPASARDQRELVAA